ncbi:hypothetical protein BKI52_10915 [marine bacterium AO1-C]|nr:hypothetical protein BKI52_10915 [marine bacterium AO1-C]
MPFSTQSNLVGYDSIYYYNPAGNRYLRFKYATGKIYCDTMPDVEFIRDRYILYCIPFGQQVYQNPHVGAIPFETWNDGVHQGHPVNNINVNLNQQETIVVQNIAQLNTGQMYEMNDVFGGNYNDGVDPDQYNQGGQPVDRQAPNKDSVVQHTANV